MVSCSAEFCPHAAVHPIKDTLLNRAVFWSTGGWGLVVSKYSASDKQFALWHFLAWMSRPEQSAHDVSRSGLCDPFRKSHLSTRYESAFLANGWGQQQVKNLFSTVLESTGLNSNAAMDFRIPGQSNYRSAWSKKQLAYLGRKERDCTNSTVDSCSTLDFVDVTPSETLSVDQLASELAAAWHKASLILRVVCFWGSFRHFGILGL